ncbi:Tyrosine recombinase XerD [Symmachiella macrocystis]|uniref:Tyrosine recombinase XerD n=1 Tax=Symmachiella macrocystis TaxID=2527985 RepID=A0A5C6BQC3_9PLAN|nr:site-specific integrase [Symmachiella macrocystis]TWU14258.1 Tyrosine recombinase XerD [Symmachiella macrocystis]
MKRAAWELTRENFLSLPEIEQLNRYLDDQIVDATGKALNTAVLDRVIITGLLYSGLRNSEFCRLTVRDARLGPGEAVLDVVGTPRQDRKVYIPQFISRRIQEYIAEIRPALLKGEVAANDASQPLIINERGRPYERTGLYRRVVRILTAAGLGAKASVQVLRHTYGYLGYLKTDGNLLFLQRQMGHAHPMVTSIYAQFVEESNAALAERLAEGIAGNDTT